MNARFSIRPLSLFGERHLISSSLISSYWVNFAKTGDPNGSGLPAWPAFTEQDQKGMVFDTAPGARPVPNLDKLKAYDAYIAWLRGQAK